MSYKLEASIGNDFHQVATKAKEISSAANFTCGSVEFDFNGINCIVNKTTNLEWLFRDYLNAFKMEWKEVGPFCVENYSSEIQQDLNNRNKIAEEKAEAQRLKYEAEEKLEREAFEEMVKGIELDLLDAEGWNKSREVNKDPYGSCVIDYAEGWGKLMQIEIAKGKTVEECYEYTQKGVGFLGITGYMFGAAVSILSQTWKHGAELKKVHNKKYGVAEDVEGTVNPAILTFE